MFFTSAANSKEPFIWPYGKGSQVNWLISNILKIRYMLVVATNTNFQVVLYILFYFFLFWQSVAITDLEHSTWTTLVLNLQISSNHKIAEVKGAYPTMPHLQIVFSMPMSFWSSQGILL